MKRFFLLIAIGTLAFQPLSGYGQTNRSTLLTRVDSSYYKAVYKALEEQLSEGVSQAVDETVASYRAFAPEVSDLVWSSAMKQVRDDAIADYLDLSTTLMVHYFPAGTLEREDYELPRNLRRQMELDQQRLLNVWAEAVREKTEWITLMLHDMAVAKTAASDQ